MRHCSAISPCSPIPTELTLLIYDTPESDTVILHLVFPDVRAIEG